MSTSSAISILHRLNFHPFKFCYSIRLEDVVRDESVFLRVVCWVTSKRRPIRGYYFPRQSLIPSSWWSKPQKLILLCTKQSAVCIGWKSLFQTESNRMFQDARTVPSSPDHTSSLAPWKFKPIRKCYHSQFSSIGWEDLVDLNQVVLLNSPLVKAYQVTMSSSGNL